MKAAAECNVGMNIDHDGLRVLLLEHGEQVLPYFAGIVNPGVG